MSKLLWEVLPLVKKVLGHKVIQRIDMFRHAGVSYDDLAPLFSALSDPAEVPGRGGVLGGREVVRIWVAARESS
jgi:hypothetical protein